MSATGGERIGQLVDLYADTETVRSLSRAWPWSGADAAPGIGVRYRR
jgi:hypothetical protein